MWHEAILWLVSTIGKLGYGGIIILMAMESSVCPVPSELVLTPAGYLASQGQMNLVLIVAAGALGSVLGSVLNYWIARWLGRPLLEKYGRFFLITPKALHHVDCFFERHGPISAFTARFLPVVRHLIALPAGLAKMSLKSFCFYTALGSAIWSTVLTLLGYWIGNNQVLIMTYLHQVTIGVLVFCVLLVGGYVLLQKRHSETSKLER